MYVVMLIVGLGFLIVTAVMGELFDFEGTHFSFLRPSVIAAALAVAGAIGVFAGNDISPLVLLPVSLAGGIAVGLLLNKLIFAPLHRAQNTSTVSQEALIGTPATVDSKIIEGGFGRIVYTVDGSRVTSPAKTEDGGSLPSGTVVKITDIQNNAFIVARVPPPAENQEEE